MFDGIKFRKELKEFDRRMKELTEGRRYSDGNGHTLVYAKPAQTWRGNIIITEWGGRYEEYTHRHEFYIRCDYMSCDEIRAIDEHAYRYEDIDRLINKFTIITKEEFYEENDNMECMQFDLENHTHLLFDGVPMKIGDVTPQYGWYGLYTLSSCPYKTTPSDWGIRAINVGVSGIDLPYSSLSLNYKDNKRITYITEEEYDRMTKEYLDAKRKEFDDVEEMFAIVDTGKYKDVTKATVVKKYVYGENNLFVEFEKRHMSDETNEVERLTMEFNQFRKKYNIRENPAIEEK